MAQTKIDEILDRMHSLQEEFELEFEKILEDKREAFQYSLQRGKVRFDKHVKSLQKKHKTALLTYFRNAKIMHILSSPIIYSIIVPLVFLDVTVTLYQQICFRIYGISLVKRSQYVVIDRQHLAYLNSIEKLNCVYCGYGNGLMGYIREIIARTEQYWCPIKHAKKVLDSHDYMNNYVDYGDAEAYRKQLETLRKSLSQLS